jgi:methyl-accepting chemotaxis protein
MEDMMNTMSELKVSSDKVNKIVKTIDDIAFQTNLLAINATVESARAGGDAGRSFAVVAQEVRSLAQKSAQNSAETAEIIDKNISLADSSRAAAENVLVLAQKNARQIIDLGKLISGINAASEEQAIGIKQINIAVSQMEKVTQENAAVAEENAASSNAMKDEITNLEDAINIAKSLVNNNKRED